MTSLCTCLRASRRNLAGGSNRAVTVLLGQGIALRSFGADADRRMPEFLGYVQRNAGLSQFAHEVRAVVAFVRVAYH
jgi:hypothetical protein